MDNESDIEKILSEVEEETEPSTSSNNSSSDGGEPHDDHEKRGNETFDDIDELVLHVNSITLAALGEALEPTSEEALTPGGKLEALASRYFKFAQQNKNIWQALFDHKMADGAPLPEWHIKEHSVLFQNITTPLSALLPQATEEEISLQTRIIFSAVHGIITICLQERIIEAPIEQLERQLQKFVRTYVQGLK